MHIRAIAALTILLLSSWSERSHGQGLRLLSEVDQSQTSVTAGGDSCGPVVSSDGRYVLFASTAQNLVRASNNLPIPGGFPESLNVFLRDRASETTTLISVSLSGVAGGNGNSVPVEISTNGQFVLFESCASDLVPGDTNNVSDIFVRDVVNGTTSLVSAATNGASGNGASLTADMTPDARRVTFVSSAYNLVAGDTNQQADVFVRDLQEGSIKLASLRPPTTWAGGSDAPQISDDGRYVAYYSNGLAMSRPVGEIYVSDLLNSNHFLASGFARTAIPSNYVVSFNHALSADGRFLAYEAAVSSSLFGTILRYGIHTGQTDIVHTNAAVSRALYENHRTIDISPDGRFIAFIANALDRSGSNTCVQLWDADTGECTLISWDLNNSIPTNTLCDWPSVDSSGQYVSFVSTATGLVTNMLNKDYHFYLRDTQAGRTTLLDCSSDGVGSGVSASSVPGLSADGRFAVFDSADGTLVAGDHNRLQDVFLRDLITGELELVSARDSALPGDTPNGPSTINANALSADGRYMVFSSEAENITPDDTNGWRDVFRQDLATGLTSLVSVSTNGGGGNGVSHDPAITPDGRYVVFSSSAPDLVSGDTNQTQDVFLRDLVAGSTVLVNTNYSRTAPARSGAFSPMVSSDGRYVLFRSKSSELVSTMIPSGENLFLRDMQLGTNYVLSFSGNVLPFPASMTPDGRFIAFSAYRGFFTTGNTFAYLWDSQLLSRIFTNVEAGYVSGVAITRDAAHLAYCASASTMSSTYDLYLVNTSTRASRLLDSSSSTNWQALRFSADGCWLAGVKAKLRAEAPKQVWLYDLQTATRTIVSAPCDSGLPGASVSDSPTISPDGRFVAYRSAESNLVAGDTNGQPDIFLYDRLGGTNLLLSATPAGQVPDHRSLMPVFSADGSMLAFQTWASDLLQDYNRGSDVFGHSFLTIVLSLGSSPLEGPWVSWPWAPGWNYRVQYKDALTDAQWVDLGGSFTTNGTRAFIQDPAPHPIQRFYRVTSF